MRQCGHMQQPPLPIAQSMPGMCTPPHLAESVPAGKCSGRGVNLLHIAPHTIPESSQASQKNEQRRSFAPECFDPCTSPLVAAVGRWYMVASPQMY